MIGVSNRYTNRCKHFTEVYQTVTHLASVLVPTSIKLFSDFVHQH